jgi:hypothetical protein
VKVGEQTPRPITADVEKMWMRCGEGNGIGGEEMGATREREAARG